jgi:hypothetical protein
LPDLQYALKDRGAGVRSTGPRKKSAVSPQPIEALIHVIRGQKVMLDADLASLYEIPTKAFNQAVRRNIERFPEDFAFQLSKQSWNIGGHRFRLCHNSFSAAR